MKTRKAKPTRARGCRWLRVLSPRNSECALPLTDLDWSMWWIGHGFSGQIVVLHVPGPEETVHRVYCQHTDTPRLGFKNGELFWLVDP